jgi:hypothetical protein
MKVLLLPDRPGWAFDRWVKGVVDYNRDLNIEYAIQYVINHRPVDWSAWDAVMVFFVMEKFFGNNAEKLIRGCFSARWVTGDYTRESAADMINGSRASIFDNHFILDDIKRFIRVPYTIIEEVADPKVFYSIGLVKEPIFTALFAGNVDFAIKRFPLVRQACDEAGISLRVANNLPLDAMNEVYNRADVLVNFSMQEGGPRTMVEAALVGVPTIIPVGVGLSDQIPCFVVKDYPDLVDTLRRLKSSRDECVRKGGEARERTLNSFTTQIQSDKCAKFLRELFG